MSLTKLFPSNAYTFFLINYKELQKENKQIQVMRLNIDWSILEDKDVWVIEWDSFSDTQSNRHSN